MREPESGKGRVKAPELIWQGIGIGDMEIEILHRLLGLHPVLLRMRLFLLPI
jgi:hypothetical protein